MKQKTNKLAQFKQWILSIVMRCEMVLIYFKCKKHIKGINNELWNGIKTTYPAAKVCNITIKEMVALLIHCA